MLSWKRSMTPQMQMEISSEGLAKALLEAHEAEERKKQDYEIIVWCHLLRWYLGQPDFTLPRAYKLSKTYLFKVMNTKLSRWYVQQGLKKFRSDEVPTPWMRNLYNEFIAWKEAGIGVYKDFAQKDYKRDKSTEQGGEKLKDAKKLRKR